MINKYVYLFLFCEIVIKFWDSNYVNVISIYLNVLNYYRLLE